jgi:cytochrome c-type biogenesis protein CcmH/NrfG
VTYLTHALRLEPNDLGSLTRLGIAEASMGNTRDATRILERVLAVAPGYDLARRALDSLSRTGRR